MLFRSKPRRRRARPPGAHQAAPMRLGVEACWTMSRPARRPGRPADPGAPGTRRPPTKKAPSTQIHTSDWGLRCGYHKAAAKGIRAGPKTPATNSETVGINGSVNVLQKGTSVPRGHNSRFVIPYFPAGVASLCFVISVAKFVGNISSYFRDFGNEIDGNIVVVFPKFRQRNRLQTFSDFPH